MATWGQYPELKSGLQEYKLLGDSSLRVSPICLGTMSFGDKWGAMGCETTKEVAEQIFNYYCDQGGNFIDTAVNYQNGTSETWLGEFIEKRGNRDELVIATKFTLPEPAGNPNFAGNGKKNMRHALALSLKRLKTDYIDLLYVHFWDYSTRPEELMRNLDDIVRSGKVLHIAISDAPSWVVACCQTIAEIRGLTKFSAYQGLYNVGTRDMEADIIPMSETLGLGVVPWSVLGAGKFTGRFVKGKEAGEGSRKVTMSDADYAVVDEILKIAKENSCTPSQVVVNWTLRQRGITSILVGASKVRHLKDNVEGLDPKFRLSDEQNKRMVDAGAFKLPFPHNFLGGTRLEDVTWGRQGGRISRK